MHKTLTTTVSSISSQQKSEMVTRTTPYIPKRGIPLHTGYNPQSAVLICGHLY
jgi:hypothetical protein